jgi:hypothetical protein
MVWKATAYHSLLYEKCAVQLFAVTLQNGKENS